MLSAVVVDGSSVFEASDFAPLYQDLLATRIGTGELTELANAITEKYRKAGYVLSRAVVPPQRVVGGVLRIRVEEGYVDDVSVTGGRDGLESYFEDVRTERPLRLATVERALLLVEDLAGVTVTDTTLQPQDAAGAYDLRVAVATSPADGVAYLDNRGTPEAGPLESWTSVTANSPLGLDEEIRLGVFTVPGDFDELLYLETRYRQPLGSNGTRLQVTGSHTTLDSGGDLAASDTESRSISAKFQVTHPLVRTRSESLWLHGVVDIYNQRESRFGATTFKDRVRAVRGRGEWWVPQLWSGSLFVTGTVSQGLDAFGASDEDDAPLSRFDADGEFTKAELEVRRIQSLTDRISLLGKATGQLSADPLLSAEEFGLGGSEYGRAYEFAEISGERGLAGLVELRFDGQPGPDWFDSWQLYGFYDIGAVWNDNIEGKFERLSLASAGVGVRARLGGAISAGLEIAKPLTFTPDAEDDKDLRAFFSLSAHVWTPPVNASVSSGSV